MQNLSKTQLQGRVLTPARAWWEVIASKTGTPGTWTLKQLAQRIAAQRGADVGLAEADESLRLLQLPDMVKDEGLKNELLAIARANLLPPAANYATMCERSIAACSPHKGSAQAAVDGAEMLRPVESSRGALKLL